MNLLIVDSDDALTERVCRALRSDCYVVDRAPTRAEALWLLSFRPFDAIVVDWSLPDGTGLQIVRAYREAERVGAVLLTSARAKVEDRVLGLEAGADDLLAKPFDLRELRARIQATLRRRPQWKARLSTIGNLTVDEERHYATICGRLVDLTSKELLILECLVREPGRVVSRSELVSRVWDENHDPASHALEVHMNNLRAKLKRARSDVVIVTRRGFGYQVVSRRPDGEGMVLGL